MKKKKNNNNNKKKMKKKKEEEEAEVEAGGRAEEEEQYYLRTKNTNQKKKKKKKLIQLFDENRPGATNERKGALLFRRKVPGGFSVKGMEGRVSRTAGAPHDSWQLSHSPFVLDFK